jgi:pyruvate dehydrogenase E2 component (dihydrolipoamide acetyltransferase)
MPTQVTLPQLGESVDSGVIVAWLVEVGDEVQVDQAIAEVSTDKVDTEIPAPRAGTVTALLAELDSEVAVGHPILELDTGAGGDPPDDVAAETAPAAAPAAPPPEERRDADRGSAPGTSRPAADVGPLSPKVKRLLRDHDVDPRSLTGHGAGGRITPADVLDAARGRAGWTAAGPLSPKVKRLLRDHHLDPREVTASGPGGRITPDDVTAAAEQRRSEPAAAPPAEPAPEPSQPAAPAPEGPAAPTRRQPEPVPVPVPTTEGARVEPLTRTRSVIAERMLQSLLTTAQLTAAVEADVTKVMLARARAKDGYRARYGASLSPLAFIARSLTRTLLRHPLLNASIDTGAGTVTYHGAVNLGLAVDTPQGLFVPNIRDAQDLTVAGLQRRITDLGTRARDRKLTADEIRGGTFTVSNTGSRGSLFDTPILNPPEVGILATPTIEKRPVVVEDELGDRVAIRHRTYLCLTYDHRLVDGADAARFLSDLAADLDGTDWGHETAELLG